MKLALAALALTAAMAWTAGAEPEPSSCIVAADKQAAVKAAPGRVLYCGLDLGSRSAKLSVVSMEHGRVTTIRDERICKRPLGMGALVFDSKTSTARDFKALRSEPVRSLYGHKALVVPALAELLLRDLGATRLVTVPQEVATGHILTNLRGR